MNRYVNFVLLVLIIGIKSENYCSAQTSEHASTLHDKWYKHYTGTLGGRPVNVNLYYYKKEIRGTYYYSDKKIVIELYSEKPKKKDSSIYLSEQVPTDEQIDFDYAHWSVIMSGDKLTGKWISKDGKKTYDINLNEEYPGGTYKFDVILADSMIHRGRSSATTSAQVSVPATDIEQGDKYFLDGVVMKNLSCKIVPGAVDYIKCLTKNKASAINDLKKELSSDGTKQELELAENLWVIYNENKWVVFESFSSEYEGGPHGMSGSSYICADLQEKRTWKLKDIIQIDSPKLSAIIEQEARRAYKIKPGEKLTSNTAFLVDAIPVTGNIYCTETGIVFSYNAYEIGPYAEGTLSFFIPFNKLKGMLRPEFKKRMNL